MTDHLDAANRCIAAAERLDPDGEGEMTVAVIAYVIAQEVFPDDRFLILGHIADATHQMPSAIIDCVEQDR